MAADRFPSPFEVETPPGAEGWERMYNWYHLFGEERRELDEQRFWFQDRLHHPRLLHPYDEIQCECWWQGLGAFNTRVFAVPPAFGVDQRILNGYLYVTPVPAPPHQIEERAEVFERRAGYYYENWEDIYADWKEKVLDRLDRIRSLDFSSLPKFEDESVVFDRVGASSGYRLIESFDRLILTMYETYQFHFEMLNIGYAAYLTFFQFCKQAFPDIPDQTISRMVGGLHVDLYRPDDELKRLAKMAERLGIGDIVLGQTDVDKLFAELEADPGGQEWVTDWRQTADPWFLVNTDPGHPGGYHIYDTWRDDPSLALASLREYIVGVREGRSLERPTEEILSERDRITGEYRALLSPDDQASFDELVGLARKVFVYIEEHVLYIEHWMWATFWDKSKELSRSLTEMGALDEPEDMFFLRRYEVAEMLYDTVAAWSVGSRARGADYWRPVITERRRIHEALEEAAPPPALGPPPDEVNEPFTVMLWGITTEMVGEWLAQQDAGDDTGGRRLKGTAGAPGVVEGPARVITRVDQLDQVQEGEVLVCPATSPSWSPIFSKLAATVSDVGGIMSHTAIVCREYGLPAVVGTGNAVATIRSGQRLRVDGEQGLVELLDD